MSLLLLRSENGMPRLEPIGSRREVLDGEGARRICHRVIGIIDGIAPVLHVGVHAALHGKDVAALSRKPHEIGGALCS